MKFVACGEKRDGVVEVEASRDEGLDEDLNNVRSVFHSSHLKGGATLCIWVDHNTGFLYSRPA